MSDQSFFDDYQLTVIIVSILVSRLGGSVDISQQDIDDIAYNRLIEQGFDSTIKLSLQRITN